MTKEEVSNNYEFKLVKRMMMRDYPWIKDVQPAGDEEEEYRTIAFLDVLIDPYELGEQKGWEIASYVEYICKFSGTFMSPYLATFFQGLNNEAYRVEKEIESKIEDIHGSVAIPQEYRFKKKLSPSEWRYTPTPKQSS